MRGHNIYKRERIKHVMFTLPAIILVAAFIGVPIIYSFVISLTKYDGIASPVFVGLKNYLDLFTSRELKEVLTNNVYFFVLGVPALTIVPLVLAILLNGEIFGHKVFKFTFLLPSVLSVVVVGVVFRVFFAYDGIINRIMNALGLEAMTQDWLGAGKTSIPIIALALLWGSFGLHTIIYLSGLAMIPPDIYESCDLDGFTWLQKLIYITIPMMITTFEFVVVLSVVATLSSMFGMIFTLTGGGPGNQTTTLEYLIYVKGFRQNSFGYASAVSSLLFIVMVVITMLIRKLFQEKE